MTYQMDSYLLTKYPYLKEKFWTEHKFLNVKQVAALWSPNEKPSELWDTDEIESSIKDKDVYFRNLEKIGRAIKNGYLRGVPEKLSKIELATWADKTRSIPHFLLTVPEFKNEYKEGERGNWFTAYNHEKQRQEKILELKKDRDRWQQSSSKDVKDLAIREKKILKLTNQIQELEHLKSVTKNTNSDGFSFITPPNMTWRDITFKLEDSHNALISYEGKKEKRFYKELGFANIRNGLPVKLWHFLVLFVVDNDKANLTEKVSKKVSDLNKKLKELFPVIDGKPIRKKRVEAGYSPDINFSANSSLKKEIDKLRAINAEEKWSKDNVPVEYMGANITPTGSDEDLYGRKKEEKK